MDKAEQSALAFFASAGAARSLDALTQDFGAVAIASGFSAVACFDLARSGEPASPQFLFGWNLGDAAVGDLRGRLSSCGVTLQAIMMSSSPVAFGLPRVEAANDEYPVSDSPGDTPEGLVVPVHGPQGEIMCVSMFAEPGAAWTARQRMTLQVAATILANRGRTLVECAREASSDSEPSPREAECAYWVHQGKSDWEIAKMLRLSEDTVAFHLSALMEKLNVSCRAEIPSSVWRNGASSQGER
jgi:DNA-binding CsgD family transcriptional regulator